MRVWFVMLPIALACASCIGVYKMEIPQGNIVGADMIDKLKPGMTRAQVRFVLGTPLITDPFHADRWDYVYLYRKSAGAAAQMRRLTAIFDGDTLARLEGDLASAAIAAPEPEHAANPTSSAEPPARVN